MATSHRLGTFWFRNQIFEPGVAFTPKILEPENRFQLGTKKYLFLSREPIFLVGFMGVSAGELGFRSILLGDLQGWAAFANYETCQVAFRRMECAVPPLD